MRINEQNFIQYLTIRRKLAPKSIKSYVIRFRIVNRWLSLHNAVLSKQSVEDFLYEKKEKEKLSNAAVNTYIQALNHIERYSNDHGLPLGFMDGIEGLPKEQTEIIILSLDEIDRLRNTHLEYKNRNGVSCGNLDKKYLSITEFLIITGCRFEEAASLKIKRLDITNGRATLVNTKNKKNRFIFFAGTIKDLLTELIKDRDPEDLVFTNSRNQHIHPGDFNNDLRLRAKIAGIQKRVHAHLLRHSFATHLLMSGVDVSMVSTLLGHKDIQTTYETYVHLADDTLQKAAMRHPLLQQYANPLEIIKSVKENIENFRLENDSRFNYLISQQGNKLIFELSVR